MGNDFAGQPLHSAEYFGDSRDYWWNADYLAMVAGQWRLAGVRTALDVGCGVGHWGRLLSRLLPEAAEVVGLEREQRWVEEAQRRTAGNIRLFYQQGTAETLPFEDSSFDLVTCQTLLIHVADPAAVLQEMKRVLRPGGLLLVAEPTNAAWLLVDAIALETSPADAGMLLAFALTCWRGKRALGEGNDLLGEQLPRLFARLELEEVQLRQNDRPWPVVAPYQTHAEKVQVQEMLDFSDRDLWVWNEATTQRYFDAGGGLAADFRAHWRRAMAQQQERAADLRAGRFSYAGGALSYLAWGRKPL